MKKRHTQQKNEYKHDRKPSNGKRRRKKNWANDRNDASYQQKRWVFVTVLKKSNTTSTNWKYETKTWIKTMNIAGEQPAKIYQ